MRKIKILIIHTAFIGDIVLSTPLVHKIKDTYPDCKLSYLTTPAGESILRNNVYIDDVIVYDKKGIDKGLLGLFFVIKKLRKEKYDIVIVPHRYLRSTIIARTTGAKDRRGYDIASGSFFYTQKIKYDRTKHEVEKLLSFIHEGPAQRYEIELFPSDDDARRTISLMKKYINRKIIVIAPGSKWFTKQWPISYFNQVIDHLKARKDVVIVIVGGREEKNLDIIKGYDIVDWRGETSLLELSALLSKSTILLTNDSAPIHIGSAYADLKILAIFGPTVKEFGFFPWSKNSKVYETNSLSCRPCSIHGGSKCPKNDFKCMLNIHPDSIIKDIESELDAKD